jgi:hypothetical protein
MSEQNAPPSHDPANSGSLAGCLRETFAKMLQGVDGMLPAKVLSYNRATNIATVQPMIQLVTTSGAKVTRASIASVPVLALGAGGFVITYPVKSGDLGWIEASDRDISLFMQAAQGGETPPNTLRKHSFSDGRFIPDVFSHYTLAAGASAGADMVIQSTDGAVSITLTPESIKIDAAADVTVTAGGAVNVEAAGGALALKSATAITLDAPSIGTTGAGASAAMSLNAGTVTIQGRDFETHQHTGVQPGSGNTGGIV